MKIELTKEIAEQFLEMVEVCYSESQGPDLSEMTETIHLIFETYPELKNNHDFIYAIYPREIK